MQPAPMADPKALLPRWASELNHTLAQGRGVILLHGNVHDLVPVFDPQAGLEAAIGLEELLASALFADRAVVLQYDRGSGLQFLAPGDRERRARMRRDFDRALVAIDIASGTAYAKTRARDPQDAFTLLDLYVQHRIADRATNEAAGSVAILVRHADSLAPDAKDLTGDTVTNIARMIGWADDPALVRAQVSILLLAATESGVHRRLRERIDAVHVPLPNAEIRRRFVEIQAVADAPASADIAAASGGLRLTDLAAALPSIATGTPVASLQASRAQIASGGLASVATPHLDLEHTLGVRATRERLEQDVELIRRGRHDAVPPGYLLCGPNGNGKAFAATCFAGALKWPALVLDGPLGRWPLAGAEHIENLFRLALAMAPVAVIVPDADERIALAPRFGDALLEQLEGEFRPERPLWLLLTARPDRLPESLRRLLPVRLPFFPAESHVERRALFAALSRRHGIKVEETAVPALRDGLSSADIEALAVACLRRATLEGQSTPSAELIGDVHKRFLSPEPAAARELQILLAVREATDLRFLPERLRAHRADADKGLALDRRIAELRTLDG